MNAYDIFNILWGCTPKEVDLLFEYAKNPLEVSSRRLTACMNKQMMEIAVNNLVNNNDQRQNEQTKTDSPTGNH